MGVKVRTKEISDGRLSLYLDFYPPIKTGNGKTTRREFLKRYNFKKPKDEAEKSINRENLLFANILRSTREKEIMNQQDGIFNTNYNKIDFIEFFQKITDKRKESDGNYGNWSSAIHYLKSFTNGKCIMADINEVFCNDFKEYLLKTNKLNSIKGLRLSQNSALSYFNKFRCAVNEAFNLRYINNNPLKYIKGIAQKESKRDFLTIEELKLLIQTKCDLDALKNAALFSAFTGLRWSDISNLTWGDIQLSEGNYFIHIFQKKTSEIIVHPISEQATTFLGNKGDSTEYIFEGLKYSDSNNDKLKRWILKAGIYKKITLHNFRHTYATFLLSKGTNIVTVSKMLGHKNIKTTMIYAKVLTETKIDAANLLKIEI